VASGDPHLAELRFEPAQALVAGADGLDALREILAGAPSHLAPGGSLFVEHGEGQAPAVRTLFESEGFTDIATTQDLAGIGRVTGGRWSGTNGRGRQGKR
jgi:release factor glutamine methyltransferase